ncbi:MAG: hypothetical protein ACRDJY_00005, partial [Thermoleophilaceae bacterium]
MAFREVSVVQVREALRRWLHGDGERPIARAAGIDRKTARRYIAAAIELGVIRDGDESQLSDELVGQVCERVRPHRPDGHGDSWRVLLGQEEQIKAWLEDDLTVVKIGVLLARRGVDVPHRTLARFAVERCGAGRRRTTVRVDDPPPGREALCGFPHSSSYVERATMRRPGRRSSVWRCPWRSGAAYSQAFQEGEKRVRWPISTGPRSRRRRLGDGPFLEGEVGVQVDAVGGANVLVAEDQG